MVEGPGALRGVVAMVTFGAITRGGVAMVITFDAGTWDGAVTTCTISPSSSPDAMAAARCCS